MNTKLVRVGFFSLLLGLLQAPLQAQSAELQWDANSQPVAGYHVYRSLSPGSDYVRLTETPLNSPSFTDATVEAGKTYYYAVTAVSDNQLESGYSNEVSFRLEDGGVGGNRIPSAQAGPSQSVREGRRFTLSGTGSDPDGDPLTFNWSQVSGPTVGLPNPEQARITLTAPGVNWETQLVFELMVQDAHGGAATDRTVVTVFGNRPPKAGIMDPGPVAYRETVYLRADAVDPDGDPLTFRWSQTAGEPVKLEGAQQRLASFSAPAERQTLSFQLTVSDGEYTSQAATSVQVLPGNLLVLPAGLDAQGSGLNEAFVGAAIANPNDRPTRIMLSGLSAQGQQLQSRPFGEELPAHGQRAFLENALPDLTAGSASLLVRGDSEDVRGFFMIGDWSLKRVDGIGGELEESPQLFFPWVRETDQEMTLLYLFNVGTEEAAVRLQLSEPDGSPHAETELAVSPYGAVLSPLSEVFGAPLELGDGYLEVESDAKLKGFVLQASEAAFAAVPGAPPRALRKLWVPHFFSEPQEHATEIRLLSADLKSTVVTIRGFDDESNLLGVFQTEIEPGQLFVKGVAEMLDLDPQDASSGYLVIDLEAGIFRDPAKVLGLVNYRLKNGSSLASMPLTAAPRSETLFLQVAQSAAARMFTGLTVVNPTQETVHVEVEAYDREGRESGHAELTLAPGRRVVELLNGSRLFGEDFEQVEGHLRVRSSGPIISFALYGDYDLDFLAAIQGQHPLN